MRSVRYEVANAASGIVDIASIAGQDDQMQVVDASACCPSVVVADGIGVGFAADEIQAQDGFDVIFGAIFQVVSPEHLLIEVGQVGCFNDALDSANRIEIVRLLCVIQAKDGLDMPFRDH
jgi:hypothetical protein